MYSPGEDSSHATRLRVFWKKRAGFSRCRDKVWRFAADRRGNAGSPKMPHCACAISIRGCVFRRRDAWGDTGTIISACFFGADGGNRSTVRLFEAGIGAFLANAAGRTRPDGGTGMAGTLAAVDEARGIPWRNGISRDRSGTAAGALQSGFNNGLVVCRRPSRLGVHDWRRNPAGGVRELRSNRANGGARASRGECQRTPAKICARNRACRDPRTGTHLSAECETQFERLAKSVPHVRRAD